MKRLSILIILLALIGTCIGCSANNASNASGDLTQKQKEKDFQYLTDIISKSYPFNDGNVKIKGLSDLNALSEDYIKRAKNTENDVEYMELINEYLIRLSQTGHAYLIKPVHIQYLNTISQEYKEYYNSYSDLNKVSSEKIAYWSKIDDFLPRPVFVQPELDIAYDNGKYLVMKDADLKTSGTAIPAGSVVEKIEGQSADDYVKSLQSKLSLNFDYENNKLYLDNPLVILPDNSSNIWNVSFKLPDGKSIDKIVSKGAPISGSINTSAANLSNVITAELSQNAGYIKIFGMGIGTGDVTKDRDAIRQFLLQSQGKYTKLIIDIRGNNGGDPAYWMDFVVAPLISKPIIYTETAAVKDDFVKLWGDNFNRYLNAEQGLLARQLHFSSVKEVTGSPYFDNSWRVFEVTREIDPKDTLPFSGKIYLLADQNSFSASEDLALFCKETGFAKIVGTRTGGGAAVFLLSHIFKLPESEILLNIEMEESLNPNGSINELVGTAPDIWMEPKPTPENYNPETLLEDKWVQKVMAEP